MKKLLILLFSFGALTAQKSKKELLTLGDSAIPIVQTNYGTQDSDIIFINVHENESISVAQTHKVLDSIKNYAIVEIQYKKDRFLTFKHKTKSYVIDPNRVFSAKGIQMSLKLLNPSIPAQTFLELENDVNIFGQNYIKNYIAGKKLIVALHNNRPPDIKKDGKLGKNALSIESYKIDGTEYENTEVSVKDNPHIEKTEDVDDFFLTTEKKHFDYLAKKGYNVVLQRKSPVEDGSLSVYAAQNKIPYINIEAQKEGSSNKGHSDQQKRMIAEVLKMIALEEKEKQ